jgi:hypothetical protein
MHIIYDDNIFTFKSLANLLLESLRDSIKIKLVYYLADCNFVLH